MLARTVWLFLAISLISGCDTLIEEDDPLFLLIEFDELCFEVSSISDGGDVSIALSSADVLDIGPSLDRENFTKDDVIGAEVTSANLRMVFPIESDLSIIRDARLTVGGSRTVATATTFSSSRSASLNLTGENIASIVRGTNFQAGLSFTGTADVSERVVIEGSITIQVEVEEL